MTDPIQTFDALKRTYLRYFDSPFDLRFEELVRARRRLLDRDGVLYREGLLEPQPPYSGSGHNIRSAPAHALTGHQDWAAGAVAELAGFAEAGLFQPRNGNVLELYAHQVAMLRAVVA